mmetsp:Transcript_10675/g.24782  ORF Transcript_10675/g.24782 Transcript_10675/m.24782 type:complete len:238 (-) Transcript_10675:1163-1876(-)
MAFKPCSELRGCHAPFPKTSACVWVCDYVAARSLCRCVCLSVCLSVICLSVCLSVLRPSVCVSACLRVCVSVCLCVCVSVCLCARVRVRCLRLSRAFKAAQLQNSRYAHRLSVLRKRRGDSDPIQGEIEAPHFLKEGGSGGESGESARDDRQCADHQPARRDERRARQPQWRPLSDEEGEEPAVPGVANRIAQLLQRLEPTQQRAALVRRRLVADEGDEGDRGDASDGHRQHRSDEC